MVKKKVVRRPPARLLYAASETEADILYPTGFFAPAPFLFIQKGKRKILVMSDLVMDRARKQASVDRVMSWSKVAAPLEKNGGKAPPADVIARALELQGIDDPLPDGVVVLHNQDSRLTHRTPSPSQLRAG